MLENLKDVNNRFYEIDDLMHGVRQAFYLMILIKRIGHKLLLLPLRKSNKLFSHIEVFDLKLNTLYRETKLV